MRDQLTVSLDAPAMYADRDPQHMAEYIAELPAQCREAWQAGLAWRPPASFRTPSRVVILGMGGSAIGAEIVSVIAANMTTVPVQLVRGYTAPMIDDDTFVIASSWSGETEETIEAFRRTLGAGAMRLAITSGGRLAQLGPSLGYSVLRYTFAGQPRAAIGWGIFALLGVLQRVGVLTVEGPLVEHVVEGLNECARGWGLNQPSESNLAKQTALRIEGRVPFILGPDFLEVAARRWAGQMAENAKQWALFGALPEIDHNLIVGFSEPAVAREAMHVLLLDSTIVHERTRLRIRLTANALTDSGVAHNELLIGGESLLETILRACYLSDWVSLYLAILNGTDPTPVAPVTKLKHALGEYALMHDIAP